MGISPFADSNSGTPFSFTDVLHDRDGFIFSRTNPFSSLRFIVVFLAYIADV